MNELIWCTFVAWYIFCGFSFARAIAADATIYSDTAPLGLGVILWGVLMPIDGLFNKGE